jgi:thioredoxin 1
MAVRAVTSLAELRTIIGQPRLTVVDFFATWCGPCKAIAPHLHQLAEKKSNVAFVKIDVDKAQEIAAEYSIRAMPTFMFFKSGQKVDGFEGADWQRVVQMVEQHETQPPRSIPPDAALEAMSAKELLALMQEYHISHHGLLEKSEYIAEIKKFR